MSSCITAYSPLPVSFTHGQGIWLYDQNGKTYLDALSGIAVTGLGHTHPEVTATIQQQAAKIIHTSNAFQIPEQQQLAQRLTKLSHTEQAFFANSGAEANEAAIKLTRLFGHHKGIDTPSVIVMEKAFHGRTMATLTASGNRKVQAGFDPLLPGFVRAPFNDIQALHTIACNRDDVVAVMLEVIQGEGGIYSADTAYLQAVEKLCQENDWLLIVDEIQTGNGRTGKYFAYMHHAIQPDIITTAKGLANGIPIGACLIGPRAANLFAPGNHGSTFGGNPLACATALTVLDVIEHDKLCQNAAKQGKKLLDTLTTTLQSIPQVKAVRGQGLMIGIELDRPAADAKKIGLEKGIIFNTTAENVIRILPPLIIQDDEVDMLIERLVSSIRGFVG